MKKSALISFIKEEILNAVAQLEEASDEDIQKQKEFNDELEKTNALMSKMDMGEETKSNTSWKKVGSGEVVTYDPTTDYFSEYELLPSNIYDLVMDMGELEDYEDTKGLLRKFEAEGWTFDYGLDNTPYGLRPIGTKITMGENLNEAREYDADAMEALGFDLYPGGRNEAFRHATEELGVPVDEILGKISDDVIYNAIHHSLQVMDMYPIEEKVNEEEDAPAGDAEVEKAASKQDIIIKNYNRLRKELKKHLEMYKDAEGDQAKEAALKMMKKISQSAEYIDAKEKYEKLKKVKE